MLCRCHGIVAILKAGIAPANAAYTDSVDVIAIGDTPIAMKGVMIFGPIMSDALVCSRLISEVDNGLPTNAHDGSSDDDIGCDTLSHCRVV